MRSYVVLDFGAATHLKATKYHGFQGTRLYCPPEWFTHSVYLGFEATVWSLGVVLYSMLNGQLPYLNEKDICTKHLLGPLPKFTEYSNGGIRSIHACSYAISPFRSRGSHSTMPCLRAFPTCKIGQNSSSQMDDGREEPFELGHHAQ